MSGKRNILREVENDMKKISVFKTDKEAAEFWDKQSFEDYHKGSTQTSFPLLCMKMFKICKAKIKRG